MGEFEDGSTVVFDNVVTDEEGKIILVNETKFNNAKLSPQQERFFRGGESVLLKGKNSANENVNLNGRLVNPNKVPLQERRVDPSELEVRIFIDGDQNLILDMKRLNLRLLNSVNTG